MITVLCCRCPSADVTARKFLQNAGLPDWATTPLIRGREAAGRWVGTLPTETTPDSRYSLASFINGASRFIVVVGHDGDRMAWSNIATKEVKGVSDAEEILERFA